MNQPHLEPSASPHLQVSLHDGILTLCIDRPTMKNALDSALYRAIEQQIRQADQDSQVQVIILRGAHHDFSAGNDMQDFVERMRQPSAEKAGNHPPFLLLKAVAQLTKPLIVAVKGVAIGIGVTLLLHADFVYADTSARFQLPFVSLGLSPEGGASRLLQQRAGYLLAADLLLTGRRFDNHEALRAGLLTACCDDPYAQAQQTATELVKLPLSAVRQTKALMQAHQIDLIQLIDDEAEIFMQRVKSPELLEAIHAFREKRPADFSRFNHALA